MEIVIIVVVIFMVDFRSWLYGEKRNIVFGELNTRAKYLWVCQVRNSTTWFTWNLKGLHIDQGTADEAQDLTVEKVRQKEKTMVVKKMLIKEDSYLWSRET